MLMLFAMLSGVGALPEKAWAADEVVCTKHVLTPSYPRLAWFARITGTVNVDVEVAADGTVRTAVASNGHNLLNRASEDNVRKWTFCSAPKDFKLKLTYVYRFEGREEYEQPEPKVSLALPKVEIVSRPPAPRGY